MYAAKSLRLHFTISCTVLHRAATNTITVVKAYIRSVLSVAGHLVLTGSGRYSARKNVGLEVRMFDYMVIDIETKDPNLLDKGPGVFRDDGYILGVGVNAPFMHLCKYFNLAHPDCTEELHDRNVKILRELFMNPCAKVFVNGLYDLGWLINWRYHFEIAGRYEDIITREALLDAYAPSYSLDFISKKYGSKGKREDRIKRICEQNGWKGAPQAHLWKMNASDISEYMSGDLEEPAYIFEQQQPRLEAENLLKVNDVECRLLRVVLDMSKEGFKIDTKKRQEVSDMLHKKYRELLVGFEEKYDMVVNFNSGRDLEELWHKLALPVEYTSKGNPSFNNAALLASGEVGHEIIHIKETKTVMNNFVDGSLVDFVCPDGRIHCNFYPAKKDDGGTITGRFACRYPNLQQIPAKKEKYGDDIRSIFIPNDGCWYGAPDFKQVEYRILSHFATGPGADEIRKAYNTDPKIDYHKYVMDLTGLDRKHAKNLNFGCLYGMGLNTMSSKFGIPMEKCKDIADQYYSNMSFVKPTMYAVQNVAARRGYVRTILGRRARVSDKMREQNKLYPMLNYLIQGTAADVMKMGMVLCYEKGLFDICRCHVTVHDELGLSVPKTREGMEAYIEIQNTLANAIKLDVPLYTDPDLGTSWGDVSEEGYIAACKEVGINV